MTTVDTKVEPTFRNIAADEKAEAERLKAARADLIEMVSKGSTDSALRKHCERAGLSDADIADAQRRVEGWVNMLKAVAKLAPFEAELRAVEKETARVEKEVEKWRRILDSERELGRLRRRRGELEQELHIARGARDSLKRLAADGKLPTALGKELSEA